jgi:predicted enzyme related to lactoylglutathione lyase
MGNPVMHFQLCAKDVDAMSAFYRDVFGWRIAPRRLTSVDADVSGTYPTIEAEEGGIAGGITDRIPAKGRAVLVIEVDDVEATMERVERLGGYQRSPGRPPERMKLAQADGTGVPFYRHEFEDPQGNLVGIIQR